MKTIARWTTLIPLFLIPFIPLYIANDLFFPFITGKGFAFRILVEIALAGYVLLALVDKKYRPRFSWTLALYSALTLWMVVANALAVNPHKAFWSNFERMDGFVTLVHVFAFFIVLGSFMTADKLWRKWWMFFLSGAALVVTYSLFQLAGMADIHQGGARVDATFGNAAYLAVYMLFVTAISLWQGLESKGWIRYLLIGFAGLSTLILFTTATRGAIIGLAGAIALGSVLWMLEAGQKKMRIAAGSILLVLIVLVGSLFALKETSFVKSEPTLSRVLSISAADGSTRFTLWGMAFEGVKERPVFGWGQEGFNYIFQKYYQPELYAQEPWFDRAHNTYIDWLVAGGIPALLLFLGLLLSAVVALYKKTASRPERIILVSALAAYGFQALFVFDNLFSYIGLAALLAAAHAVASRPIQKLEALPELKEQTASAVALPIVLAVGVGIIWMVNVPSITQASKLVRALNYVQSAPAQAFIYFKEAAATSGLGSQEVSEQLVSFSGTMKSRTDLSTDTRLEIFKYALSRMGEEVARIPKDARLRVEYAVGFRAANAFKDALAQTEEALKLSPKKQTIMMERGFELWESGDLKGARDMFVHMYELDTSFKALASYAAAGEIAAGNTEAGNAILMNAYGTTQVDDEALVIAYYQAKQYENLIGALKLHLEKNDSIESYMRLASAYAIAGQSGNARATAQQALAKHPEAAQSIAEFLTHVPN